MIAIQGTGPVVAAAIHAGHNLRKEVEEWMALNDKARLREEDPYTDAWTSVADIRIIGETSRFELDVNRQRAHAIYLTPEEAWGLKVWKGSLPGDLIECSLKKYDAFYREATKILSELQERTGPFVVLDLHSYNQIRPDPDSPPADPELNPEVIVGTSNMDRKRWAPVVDRLIGNLRSFDFFGRRLDVRENVKWTGGAFSQWIHNTFPKYGCSFAIEFKKIFMNEWTGELYPELHEAIGRALRHAVRGLTQELKNLKGKWVGKDI